LANPQSSASETRLGIAGAAGALSCALLLGLGASLVSPSASSSRLFDISRLEEQGEAHTQRHEEEERLSRRRTRRSNNTRRSSWCSWSSLLLVIGGRFGGDLLARTTAKLLELLCFAAQAPRLLNASCGLFLLLCVLAIGTISTARDTLKRDTCVDQCHRVSVSDSHSRLHHEYNNDKRENRTKRSTQRPASRRIVGSRTCTLR